MKIRKKILLYFSTTVIAIFAISLYLIFILFSAHREEEFQQLQFSKIKQTIGLIDEFNKISEKVSLLLDKQDIHDFYDEKLLIYNNNKKLIFSSIDSLEIAKSEQILNNLSVNKDWIETKEGEYDIIGTYIESNGTSYYGISKAYDLPGYLKRDFLKKILIIIFAAIVIIVITISIYLSRIITKPITDFTNKIDELDLSNPPNKGIKIKTTTSELINLSDKFNELMKRTNNAFIFQKNSINYISHELKTPITVLVSELEKIEKQTNLDEIKSNLTFQIQKAKSLGSIINVLLQISKIESGQEINRNNIRIDDLVFDCISEVNKLFSDFNFEVNFNSENFNEQILNHNINQPLVKQAFLNLFMNAVQYSNDKKAKITFHNSSNELKISISNSGKTLSNKEQKYLFTHFFRGKNSQNQSGFGLGLVLSQRIFNIHNIKINYEVNNKDENTFILTFSEA